MNLFELKKQLEEGEIKGCYYLFGNDNYMIKQAEKAIVQSLNIQYPELNLNNFSDNIVIGDLVDTLKTLPFMSKYRLVIVKELYPNAADITYFENEFLNNSFDECVCIIINTKSFANFETKLKNIERVNCNHPPLADCQKWIIKKMNIMGLDISQTNARLLAEYVLCDMSSISLQCEKLVSYLAGSGEVTLDDINQLVNKQTEYQIYEFTNAIAIKDRRNAYTIMESFIEKKSDAVSLLGALYSYYRRMLFALVSKKTTAELNKCFNIQEYAVKKLMEQARKFSPKSLKDAVVLIQNADYMLKSGYMESGNALNFVVLKLMNL